MEGVKEAWCFDTPEMQTAARTLHGTVACRSALARTWALDWPKKRHTLAHMKDDWRWA